jgi:hypothetical protein
MEFVIMAIKFCMSFQSIFLLYIFLIRERTNYNFYFILLKIHYAFEKLHN